MRAVWSFAVVGVLLVVGGCQKSEEPPQKAVVAVNGLMPTASVGLPAAYVADQKQVKMIERTVSYEPLDSFMKQNAERKAKMFAPVIQVAKPKAPKAVAAKGGQKPEKKGGLFSKLKNGVAEKVMGIAGGLGGGLPPVDGAVAPPVKGDGQGQPADTEDEEAEGESTEEDEAADADEDEEATDDGEEAGESDEDAKADDENAEADDEEGADEEGDESSDEDGASEDEEDADDESDDKDSDEEEASDE